MNVVKYVMVGIQPIVLDIGSGLTKAGYADRAEPVCMFGSVVGVPKYRRIMASEGQEMDSSNMSALGVGKYDLPDNVVRLSNGRRLLVGEKLRKAAGVASLTWPIRRGAVVDWEAAEEIWKYAIHSGLKASDEHPALITENIGNARSNREKMAEIFFESLRSPSLYVVAPPVLSLYASGRTSGIVLDVGSDCTTALAVSNGYKAHPNAKRTNLGGTDVDERLILLLRKSGVVLGNGTNEIQAVRRLKERHAFVAVNPNQAEEAAKKKGAAVEKFELPDGNIIYLGAERFRASEIFFRPELAGLETPGVAHHVGKAIDDADIELRKMLYGNVLVAGGSTKMKGFAPRLLEDLRKSAKPGTKVRIHAPRDRLTSAFVGGTVLSSLSTFRQMVITKKEYKEHGTSIIHRKTY